MKTSNTILCSLLGVVLVVASLLMARFWPHTLRDDQCSPLYQRYCHTPGIEASYVKGFRINDTLAIDATLLHATDSASWERLLNDFNLPETTKEIAKESPNTIFVRRVSRKNPHVRADSPDEPFYILETIYSERSIHIYDVKDFDQNVDLHIQLVLNMTKHN